MMSQIESPVIIEPELEDDEMPVRELLKNYPNLKLSEEFTPEVVPTNNAPANSANSLLDQHRQLKFQEAYKVTSNTRGRCLIINNREFKNLDKRDGTDKDCERLYELFTHLNYHVTVYNNCTADEIFSHCSTFILDKEFELDSCILCILSHGKQDKIYGTDGKTVNEKEILDLFNHDSCKLKGKPKLVIIQACRTTVKKSIGRKLPACLRGNFPDTKDEGTATGEVQLIQELRELNVQDEIKLNAAVAPANSDIIIAYSTVPGQLSYRNAVHGSWFIQALVQVFKTRSDTEHVADMLVMVKRIVSEAFSGMQLPRPANHLLKKFYFFP